ncbi:uncharacterized small membrane protein [Spongiibacter sp. IMCC21906]|jgi:uncharacterized membrane protein YgdD (TMEM256/DUF423 family)|uniref:DUF423 domain-containing protein n=1 Tax=Spongiibacter sp. IMCC21906 TaxID=1620392 RepID=UPI00062DFE97|nr:DUF423 domain-containing protein [Spongiibacter sp. IMCC21906]AKH67819.1 uncharacterized small membrane protein [Spongiibacter sp. IMCC21906]
MASISLFLTAIFGFLAVALGAFGAHGLKAKLSPEMMTVYQTAVQYHFFHTLALLGVAVLLQQQGVQHPTLKACVWLFALGIVVFSGSLYALALTNIRILGAITPIGGVLFMAAWVCLAVAAWKTF